MPFSTKIPHKIPVNPFDSDPMRNTVLVVTGCFSPALRQPYPLSSMTELSFSKATAIPGSGEDWPVWRMYRSKSAAMRSARVSEGAATVVFLVGKEGADS